MIGGEQFDDRLVAMMHEHYLSKHSMDGINELNEQRMFAKYRKSAKKVKEVLSANESFSVYIEGLTGDVDFNMVITRKAFLENCADLMENITAPIESALVKANLTVADIDAVELVGGAVRIPAVQEVVKAYFEKDIVGVHLNGDDAFALGAAFRAANMSTTFRVRKVEVTDTFPHAVGVDVANLKNDDIAVEIEEEADLENEDEITSEEPWSKSTTIFPVNTKLGQRKTLGFHHSEDIVVDLVHEPESLSSGNCVHISQHEVTGIEELSKEIETSPKVVLGFTLTSSGIPMLTKAEAQYEVSVNVTEPAPVVEVIEVEEAEAANNETEEEQEQAQTEEEAENTSENTDDESQETSVEEEKTTEESTEETVETETEAEVEAKPESETESETKEEEEKEEEIIPVEIEEKKEPEMITVTKLVKKTKQLKLTHNQSDKCKVHWLTKEEFKTSARRLKDMEEAILARKRTQKAKNDVETAVYAMRSELWEDDVETVSTEDERDALRDYLEECEDWLYDEGDNTTIEIYEAKNDELKDRFKGIIHRSVELKARPRVIKVARKLLAGVPDKMAQWETKKKQVTEEERNDVLAKTKKTSEWLEKRVKEIEDSDPIQDPPTTCSQIEKEIRGVRELIKKLSKKPVPKPEKKKEEKKEKEEESKPEGKEEDKEKTEEDATVNVEEEEQINEETPVNEENIETNEEVPEKESSIEEEDKEEKETVTDEL
eukprot:TRINITY_DN4791_c0_g2_i1.p1 TRINITY_DN4791_c0_g2~~TRINITY_DN4791_c0_g2_i1.p1  ORF type:complete len:779 (-),score=402.19 TRINITY_DN4791_c0_g2_i1:119-2275(-)